MESGMISAPRSLDLHLGLGLTERLAFDTLTFWGAVIGSVLLVSDYRPLHPVHAGTSTVAVPAS